jgi:hypothetical protein
MALCLVAAAAWHGTCEIVGVVDMVGEVCMGGGGEDMTAEDSTTHSNTTNDTLPHHNPSHHTTPIPVEIFPPSTAPAMKAIVLLPCDGVLRACGLVVVRVNRVDR